MRVLIVSSLLFGAANLALSFAGEPPLAAQPRQAAVSNGPNIFGSVGLPLGLTRYSERWRRVALVDARPDLRQLTKSAQGLAPAAKAQFINAAFNHRIRYRFDANASGDHWSTALETLDRGAGDCEDFAIAKMHALRQLGVPARDLFMTIGHDSGAGIAHAVLVVRLQGQFWLLDNRADHLIPQQEYRDFYPIMSFSAAGDSWLHGYPVGKTPPAVKAMSLALYQGRAVNVGNSPASRRRVRS